MADRFEGEIGIDGIATITEEEGEVVNLAGFRRFQDEGDAGAGSLADEVVMQARDCEQCRDGCLFSADLAVGENEDVDAVTNRGIGVFEEFLKGGFEAFTGDGGLGNAVMPFRESTHGGFKSHAEARRVEPIELDLVELCELPVIEEGALELDHAATFGAGTGKIAFGADKGNASGHQFFADRVNWRIGNLCKELFEVVVEQL